MPFHIAKPENDEGHLWKLKTTNLKFLEARDGDSLLQPFQCDFCWFENLQGRAPISDNVKDQLLLGHIRRVNLDLFWSRASGTVKSYVSAFRKGIQMDHELGLIPRHPNPGPWPLRDDVGFQVALQIVAASKLAGHNDPVYQQFDTIRRIRTVFAHLFERSCEASKDSWVLKKSNKGDVLHTSNCPTNSLFFTRFMEGLLKRMNKDVRSDLALDPAILKLLLKNLESELRSPNLSHERRRMIIISGAYFVICYACSLRGNEGFMIYAGALIRYFSCGSLDDDIPHVVIPLLGRFKNEVGERFHLMLSVNETRSGLNI